MDPDGNWIQTEYQTVPPVPTALIGFAVFYTDDFDRRTTQAIHPITGRRTNVCIINKNFY